MVCQSLLACALALLFASRASLDHRALRHLGHRDCCGLWLHICALSCVEPSSAGEEHSFLGQHAGEARARQHTAGPQARRHCRCWLSSRAPIYTAAVMLHVVCWALAAQPLAGGVALSSRVSALPACSAEARTRPAGASLRTRSWRTCSSSHSRCRACRSAFTSSSARLSPPRPLTWKTAAPVTASTARCAPQLHASECHWLHGMCVPSEVLVLTICTSSDK